MSGFVSIIMPVYQAEAWLENSITSILRQNHANYELLLIENGSTDSSAMICDRFAERYSQIFSFHQESKGVSSARNAGLEYARGDYILFVDCDDTLDINTLNVIVDRIESSKADVLIYNFSRRYSPGYNENVMVDLAEGLYRNKDIIAVFMKLYDSSIVSNIGTKLYKRNLIGDIRFDENMDVFEDISFCMSVLQKADSLFFLNQNLYHYEFKNINSLSAVFKYNYYENFCDFFQELYCWGMGTQNFENWFYIRFMQGIWAAIKNAKMKENNFKNEFGKIVRNPTIKLAELNIKRNKFDSVTWKERIQFSMIWYRCYWGVKLLWN